MDKHNIYLFYSLLFWTFFNNLNKILTFIYFWEINRAQVGEGQRENETESEAGSRLWALSIQPDVGLEPTNYEIMTWAKVRHLTEWATQAPL